MTDSIKSMIVRRDRLQREFAMLGDIQPESLVENLQKVLQMARHESLVRIATGCRE